MRVSVILAAILLLVLYSVSTMPTLTVQWDFLSFSIDNPLHFVAQVELFNFFGFSLTIGWVVLALAILMLVLGVLR